MCRSKAVISPELTAFNAESLGKVVRSPHSDVAWLEPHQYCWVPAAATVPSSDASAQDDGATNVAVARHGSPTWTGAIPGTVPEAENIGAPAYLLHTPPCGLTVHVVDASIIGAHLRRAQEAPYRGIKGPTSHLVNQHALNWIVEGLRRLLRRVGGAHHWVVRQSSHLAAVPLEEPDFAAAHAKAPPVHLAKGTCNPLGARGRWGSRTTCALHASSLVGKGGGMALLGRAQQGSHAVGCCMRSCASGDGTSWPYER